MLVLVLLVLIYRSPVFWIIPILSVVAAEQLLRAAGYALTEVGVTVNGQTAGIALILVFGAGTDYALLLVARYREELRHTESTYQAMRLGAGRRSARDHRLRRNRHRSTAGRHARRGQLHGGAGTPLGSRGGIGHDLVADAAARRCS